MAQPAQNRDVIFFGPFSLVASERLLMKDGTSVELGARTLDTLIALVSHPNEIVGKRELMAKVWPDVVVEEGSLRFHIAALRKALGDGKDGVRYISTLAGRGYCFVAPISRSNGQPDGIATAAAFKDSNLPTRSTRMVGRTDDVFTLTNLLRVSRFVTVVGPGGVGKTTVAVAVVHDLLDAFAGAVLFVDLGALSDAGLVASAVTSMLGLSVQSEDPTPSLIAYLRDKQLLLVLDSCEHLIDTVAAIAERIYLEAPQVHILATSREALRVEGEQVYRLMPLTFPPDDPGLTAADALTFPAIQLFVERAAASGVRLDLNDQDAAIVAGICRKLDGVALAIELTAARVATYGLQQTAALLDQRLALEWPGHRTAPPRQKTLHATLDWSYELLSDVECAVLRRLAVFVDHFTLQAAEAVATSARIDQGQVVGAIESLVSKSMVTADPVGSTMRYRLLDTTRAYVLEIEIDDIEVADVATRHATYYRKWLEQTVAGWSTLRNVTDRLPHLHDLNNARSALEWCFGINGNAELGVELASAAAPVFLAMSLLTECHRWSERAILALDDETRGGRMEMRLQAALGLSLMFTRGESEASCAALRRGLVIAEERGDILNQVQVLGLLHLLHTRGGEFKTALQYAKRNCALSVDSGDPVANALARSMLGASLQSTGDLGGARIELSAALKHGLDSQPTNIILLAFDHRTVAGVALAKTLWLQGHPAQALERARRTVRDAARLGHPVTLSIALNGAISVFLWTGDLQSADEHIDWFIAHAEAHSMAPYLIVARGLKGLLAIRRGDAKDGVENLQSCLQDLHVAGYRSFTTTFNISLAQGFAATGQFAEGVTLIDDTIKLIEANGDVLYIPEALRVKGNLLFGLQPSGSDAAETCLFQAVELSRRQGARAWELRASVDLARLLVARDRPKRARPLLQGILEQFTEGFDTADLIEAKRLLASLS
ncbi:ATP-binding protein [Bradyrhizobium sp. SYSU BS000235]|uniref:ATP-binding protein n=1 Tax=Bradyrhizobium sp. SYSU BS000235 TaxID=3411332 RepID=UPI003C73891D